MIVFLSARLLPLYRSLTAASNSSLVAMLTRLIPPSARLPSREQLRRGNRHDSGAVLARQCAREMDCVIAHRLAGNPRPPGRRVMPSDAKKREPLWAALK